MKFDQEPPIAKYKDCVISTWLWQEHIFFMCILQTKLSPTFLYLVSPLKITIALSLQIKCLLSQIRRQKPMFRWLELDSFPDDWPQILRQVKLACFGRSTW